MAKPGNDLPLWIAYSGIALGLHHFRTLLAGVAAAGQMIDGTGIHVEGVRQRALLSSGMLQYKT